MKKTDDVIIFLFGLALALWILSRAVENLRAHHTDPLASCDKHMEAEGRPPFVYVDREHVDSKDCWCHPTLFFDGQGEFKNVWVHKGEGEELPPSRILISALADAMSGRKTE